MSNEFICVIKSGIKATMGLPYLCLIICISPSLIDYRTPSILYDRFTGLKIDFGMNNYIISYLELVWCVSCFALARSLSSAIDPGITFRPCIALTTEERGRLFSRRCLAKKCTKVQLCSIIAVFGAVCLVLIFIFLFHKVRYFVKCR